jgi:prophage DNA circulation protein
MQRLAELARGGGTARSTTPLQTIPALVLAHSLYGDAWYQSARADELVARNRIIHPGFVPAGRAVTYIDS